MTPEEDALALLGEFKQSELNLVLLRRFSSKEEVSWLLQVAVLLLKRWIRFLARERVQSSAEETKHTHTNKKNPQDNNSYATREVWLAFIMLIFIEVQYLHAERLDYCRETRCIITCSLCIEV